MPNRTIAIIVSALIVTISAVSWPAVPALAGFPPTPRPTNTPIPPTDTPVSPTDTPVAPTPVPPTNTPPSQPPPGKEPKDTPLPTATLNLTSTPVVLPVGGGEMDTKSSAQIVLLSIIVPVAIVLAIWLFSSQRRES